MGIEETIQTCSLHVSDHWFLFVIAFLIICLMSHFKPVSIMMISNLFWP